MDTWKLLFGNVDTQGGDEDVLDQETRTSLAGAGIFQLSDLGIGGGDLERDAQSNVDFNEKAVDSVDFEDEDELAEDEEEEKKVESKPAPTPTPAPPQPMIKPTYRPAVETQRQIPKAAEKKKEVVFPQNAILAKPPNEDGPILKFSELFAPSQSRVRHLQRKSRRRKKDIPQITQFDEESDDYEKFVALKEEKQRIASSVKRSTEVAEHVEETESEDEAQDLNKKLAGLKVGHALKASINIQPIEELPESRDYFDSVNQQTWESNIIWDESEVVPKKREVPPPLSSKKTDKTSADQKEAHETLKPEITINFVSPARKPRTNKNLWGDVTVRAPTTDNHHQQQPQPAQSQQSQQTQQPQPQPQPPPAPTPQPQQQPAIPPQIQQTTTATVTTTTSATPAPAAAAATTTTQPTGDNPPADSASTAPQQPPVRQKRKYTRRAKPPVVEPPPKLEEETNKSDKEDETIKALVPTTKEKALEPIDIVKPETKQVFAHVMNESLFSCDWLDTVVWDDEVEPKAPPLTDLILDKETFEEVQKLLRKRKDTSSAPGRVAGMFNRYLNASNDRFYEITHTQKGAQSKSGKQLIAHSKPALNLSKAFFPPYIPEEELLRFHRPRAYFPPKRIMPIIYREPKPAKARERSKPIEKKADLTTTDHRLVLVEYIEERPPLLNNVGMGTKFVSYYKKKAGDIGKIPKAADGITVALEADQNTLPLFGPLKEGEMFKSMQNAMFNAEIFKHNIPSTDFFLTARKTKNGTKFFLREIDSLFVSGHEQPLVEVPQPNTRASLNFAKNRLMIDVFKKFKEREKTEGVKRLRMDDIKDEFPQISEPLIRKQLKECADFQRGGGDSGWWTLRPNHPIPTEDEMRLLVTPELVCMDESMRAGQQRLEEYGVATHATVSRFASSNDKRLEGKDDVKLAIQFIENERTHAPWNATANFISAATGRDGASLPALPVAQENLTKEEMEYYSQLLDSISAKDKKELDRQAAASGPDISAPQAKQILLEKGGYSAERLRKMTKADQIVLAKRILESGGKEGLGTRSSRAAAASAAKHAKFKEILDMIFDREAEKLSHGYKYYPSDTEDEESESEAKDTMSDLDADDLDIANELENALIAAAGASSSSARKGKSLRDKIYGIDEDDIDEELEKEEYNRLFEDQGLFGDGASDSDTASVTSTLSHRQKKKRHAIRKIVTVTNPDGTTSERVEIIRDPALVEFYMKRKDEGNQPRRRRKTDTWQQRKEKGKWLHEMRQKKAQEEEERRRQEGKRRTVTCGVCGEVGHMATNRACRFFSQKSDLVRVEDGTKIKIKKEALTPVQGLKIQIPSTVVSQVQEKTKKRGSSNANAFDDDDDFEYISPKPGKRRRVTSADKIAAELEKIHAAILKDLSSFPFREPVDTKAFPDYKKVISHPMDLRTIEKRIKNLNYVEPERFLDDIKLMVRNAETYCADRFPNVVSDARRVLSLALAEYEKAKPTFDRIKAEEAAATPRSATSSKNHFAVPSTPASASNRGRHGIGGPHDENNNSQNHGHSGQSTQLDFLDNSTNQYGGGGGYEGGEEGDDGEEMVELEEEVEEEEEGGEHSNGYAAEYGL